MRRNTIDYYCAHACAEAYKPTPNNFLPKKANQSTPTWNFSPISTRNNQGFSAIAYENSTSKEIIIAFRGTVLNNFSEFKLNLRTDILLALNLAPNTLHYAYKFVETILLDSRYINHKFYLTGHSLGAAIAEILACYYYQNANYKETITFESPGVSHYAEILIPIKISVTGGYRLEKLTQQPGYRTNRENHITSYKMAPNIINSLHPPLVKPIRLYSNPGQWISAPTWQHAAICSANTAGLVALDKQLELGITAFFLRQLSEFAQHFTVTEEYQEGAAVAAAGLAGWLSGKLEGKLPAPAILMLSLTAGLLMVGFSDSYDLVKKHSMKTVLTCFDPSNQLPYHCERVSKWPSFTQQTIPARLAYEGVGFLNLFAERNALTLFREHRVIDGNSLVELLTPKTLIR